MWRCVCECDEPRYSYASASVCVLGDVNGWKQRMLETLLLVIGRQFTPEPINKYFKHIVCRRWIILNGQSVHNLNFHLSFLNTFHNNNNHIQNSEPVNRICRYFCIVFSLHLFFRIVLVHFSFFSYVCSFPFVFFSSFVNTVTSHKVCARQTTEIILHILQAIDNMALWKLTTYAHLLSTFDLKAPPPPKKTREIQLTHTKT